MTETIRLLGKKILATGWGTLTSHTIAHKRRDGTTHTLEREVYDHGNASAILLLDPDAKKVTLVRQFRLPPHLLGDDGHLIEVCAGLLDGDTPQDCAQKEALEETGIAPHTLLRAFEIYPSPGSLSERTHCFVGLYDASCRIGPGGGLAHEGEDIEILEMPANAALAMIGTGEIVDGKTVALLQFAALEGLFSSSR